MDADIASRVFEPFFTTKTVGQGSGMGLAMVHGFIHSSEGHIQVDTKPGKGTTITLYFPACDTDGKLTTELKQPTNNQTKQATKQGQKILVVDDEEPVAKLISEFLELINYRVEYTTSSLEALRCFKASPSNYDLIITDQAMPELTGLDLINEVRKIDPNIPIVICSGYSDVVNETNARDKGASYYLPKPIDEAVLIHTVSNLFDQAKKQN